MDDDRAPSQTERADALQPDPSAGEELAAGRPDRDGGSDSDTALTYEQARDELAEVVRRLEAGGATLEESLALWERGETLAAICEQRLNGVRARLAEAGVAEAERAGNEASRE